MSQMPAARGRMQGQLVVWVLRQLGQALALLAQLLGLGIVQAIVRRQFCWGAFAAACASIAAGFAAMGLWGAASASGQLGHAESTLWMQAAAVMALGGLVGGRTGRRVAFWELYLATAVMVGALAFYLAASPGQLWPGGGEDGLGVTLTYGLPRSRGALLLGPMWARLLGLGSIVGFFVALIGGSVAALVSIDGSGADVGVGLETWVARRHLQGQRRSGPSVTAVVAVVGIGLGVASLIAVTAVMSGYQQDIQAKILSTNAHLVVQKYGVDFAEYAQVMQRARAVPGVVGASPFTFNEAMLNAGPASVGVLIKGIDPHTAGEVTDVASHLCQPDSDGGGCTALGPQSGQAALVRLLQSDGGPPPALVGAALYRRLGQPLGAQVSITTPVGMAGAQGNAPRRMAFRLAGVFRSGMHEFDARLIYVGLAPSQQLMGMGSAVNGVELRVGDPEHVEAVGQRVLGAVGRYPYRSLDWRELNQGIFTALRLQKVVMFLVLTFIVVVAAFNIASTLFMAVVEKAREIAVLKSMGAKDGTIMKIFVFEGWMTGLAGTALGVVLGLGVAMLLGQLQLGIAADVYMVDALQVRIRFAEVAITVAAALGIAHLATLYPALKAARTRPTDAMRYD
jgi:lipoprotein-releasing system permease protein